MFLRAVLAFVALPGLFAIVVPLLIAFCDSWRGGIWLPGCPVVVTGAFVLLKCARDFYASGRGTLAPCDPPKNLVVDGLYRYVRNPMYIGVLILVLGWALVTHSRAVGIYSVFLAVGFHIRILTHEEPYLSRQFPSRWSEYAASVSRWLPRITPWEGPPGAVFKGHDSQA